MCGGVEDGGRPGERRRGVGEGWGPGERWVGEGEVDERKGAG